MASIAERQEQREDENIQKYANAAAQGTNTESKEHAARTLQRTYRGHRTRRELKGLSLTPSARWTEAIKEAKYRELTTPRPSSSPQSPGANKNQLQSKPTTPRDQWTRIGKIARRAGDDSYASDDDDPSLSPSARELRRQTRRSQTEERMKTARTMDLRYFLEMVDLHHRYGSHLRKYHAEWRKSSTHENFFYWLDYGEGRNVSLEQCPREKLDAMKVRYLGREERVNYAVEVGMGGRLCWKRNGFRVETSEGFRDSIKGIVRVDDEAPAPNPGLGFYVSSSESSGLSSLSSGSDTEGEKKKKKEKPTSENAAKIKGGWRQFKDDTKARILEHRPFKHSPKEKHDSVDKIPNKDSQSHQSDSPEKKKKKKKNLWIFVADTSHNLYIGIKQSGAFQHSSFLHGGRVSAAGLIKVREGQLRYLQPRSGHYKPPASSFRAFIHSLQDRKVDMSVLCVPRSYAVLVGMEGYTGVLKDVGRVKRVFGVGGGEGGDSGEEEGDGEGRKREKEREEAKG